MFVIWSLLKSRFWLVHGNVIDGCLFIYKIIGFSFEGQLNIAFRADSSIRNSFSNSSIIACLSVICASSKAFLVAFSYDFGVITFL